MIAGKKGLSICVGFHIFDDVYVCRLVDPLVCVKVPFLGNHNIAQCRLCLTNSDRPLAFQTKYQSVSSSDGDLDRGRDILVAMLRRRRLGERVLDRD